MVDRVGAYGAVDVNWQAGYPTGGLPIGFNEGTVTPNSGLVSFDHGVSQRAITILLKPVSIQDLFAMHITSVQSSDDGGAREDQERSLIEIAPSGIISFDENSRNILVDETEGEVQLVIQRQLGAQGVVTVVYQTTASTAVPGQDYVEISGGVVRLRDGQQTATVTIGLLAENSPELEKVFFVNLTSVDSGDGNQGELETQQTPTEYLFCEILLPVRKKVTGYWYQETLRPSFVTGADRGWRRTMESDVISQFANDWHNCAALLAAERNASAGLDYRVLEESIIFRENENSDTVQLEVCDDNEPEPAETFYVYLTVVAGGGRVAGPGDTPQRGFTEVIILGNDNFNGIIGFSDSSLYVSVSEDVDPTVILNMDRGSAFFEMVTVDWRASYSTSGDMSLDQELTNQLVEVEGSIQCPARVQICELPITLKQDLEPEFSRTFAVELIGVRRDATLNPARKFANITMQDSDHPYGQFGFALEQGKLVSDVLYLSVILVLFGLVFANEIRLV
ncbi:putative G-protein coupled receptor [Apostichopus japonicus]|uniref:Putative G-protein coupled receptor n=1 Tax=Stichopus japonicus TaxID=307972 RepID=A0A2G8JEI6_STIJA|nr:putative G-protein coupled receptor [Apostichopus japonicus]